MYQAPYWRTRPLFVSSTFLDMQAERDYLRDVVFPAVEEELRKRYLHLEAIDLRWGVDTPTQEHEEAKELLVLKVCLGEIERSRPFLVVLLGDRYGWVPDAARMKVAVDEAGFVTDVTGKSITALEIEYGVLASPVQVVRSRFYFRRPLPYHQMDKATAAKYSDKHNPETAHNALRLEELKADIVSRMKPLKRVRSYPAKWDRAAGRVTGLKAFGALVKKGLLKDIEQELGPLLRQEPPTWQERQQADLDEFVEHRRRGFRGRKAIRKELVAFALGSEGASQSWGLCLSGEPGSGKSAIYACVHRLLLRFQKQGRLLLLTHAAGITPEAGRVDLMLRRWVGEMAVFLGQADPLDDKSTPEEIEQAFSMLLRQAGQRRRVVVLMDALNQLEDLPRARNLTWLPKAWPENARLIATAVPGPEAQALAARDGVVSRDLPALDEHEAAAIFASVCARYHRTLPKEALDILRAKRRGDNQPAAGNALWLFTATEELNLLDSDDLARTESGEFTGTPEQRLHQLLLKVADELLAEIEALYAWLLKRSEKLWGLAWARGFANLIALSRAGWRESDFDALLPRLTGEPWDPARFAGLRRSFRAHIARKGAQGQWDFFHAQARPAVLKRNLGDAGKVRALHMAMADHLLALPAADPLHISETMHHLYEADDKQRAAEYYGSELSEAETLGASTVLAGRILYGHNQDATLALAWVVSLLDQELPVDNLVMLCTSLYYDLHEHLKNTARLYNQLILLKATHNRIAILAKKSERDLFVKRCVAVNLQRIGDIQHKQGKQDEALATYQESLAIFEELFRADGSNLGRQIECGVCHQRIGDIRLALGDLAGAMRSFKTSLHIDTMVEVTVKLTQVGADRVEVLHNISISMEKVGIALLALGQLNDAMNICEEVLSIRKQLVQQNPKNELLLRNLAVSHEKIGELLTLNGKLPEALTALQTALAIREKLFGWQQVNTEWQRDLTVSQEKVGHILLMLGKLDEALENFRVCLSVRNNLVAIDQDNETWQIDLTNCYDLIGKALEGKSDYPAAMSAYQASFIIRKGLTDSPPQYRPDLHSILAYSYQHIGNLQLLQEDPKAAINALQTCLDIRRNVVNEFPDNPKWQIALSQTHEMIGDVWLAREDVDAALGEYKAALTISDALVLANPENQDWKMNLSICLGKVGDAHLKQGQHEMALAKYQESLKIPQVLADGDKGNFLWQSKLAAMHERIGGALKKQGKFNESLDAYQVSLDIRQDLVKTYDGNETLHWELSISHIKMGDALEAQGNLTAAMEQYLACLSIRKNLADFHPANNAWQEALEEINYFIHEGLQKLWLRNRALNNLSEMFASLNDILVAVKQLATIYKNNTFAQLELIWVNILLAQCYEDQDKYSPNAFNYKHANEHWSHAYEIYIGMINHGLKKSKVDKLAAPLLEFMNIAIDHYLIDTAGEEDNILAWLKTMVSETERQFNQKLVSLFHKEINKEYEIVHLGFVVDKCIKLLKKGRVMEFTSPHLFSAVVNLSDRSGKPMGKIIREVLSRLKSEGLGEQAKEFKNYLEEMSVPGYGKSFWQTLLRVILRR